VAKHGNFGVSSVCGSSDVLAYFGYDFPEPAGPDAGAAGAGGHVLLHAAAFHPAMRHAAPVRRELGVRTFFKHSGAAGQSGAAALPAGGRVQPGAAAALSNTCFSKPTPPTPWCTPWMATMSSA
jgi:hypothetical protein